MAARQWIERLDDPAPGLRICLYGTGSLGSDMAHILAENRPDLKIVCFGDSHRTGRHLGLEIRGPEQLAARRDWDLILIASQFHAEIADALEQRGLGPLAAIDPEIRGRLFTDAQKVEIARTRALFHREEDRLLYDLLIRARNTNLRDLSDHVARHGWTEAQQYLDFVRFAQMRVVIEGGVLGGENALAFLERMPAGGRLIGFEPDLETYTHSPLRKDLARHDIEVVPLALWHEPAELRFLTERGPERVGSSRVVGDGPEHADTTVQGITLDSFVAERGLERVDFIKLDIEGAEPNALRGAVATLTRFRPQLAICIYHQRAHLYEIPLWLDDHLTGYRYALGHYGPDIWETVFYAVPEELMRD